jgi:hypothetical protein
MAGFCAICAVRHAVKAEISALPFGAADDMRRAKGRRSTCQARFFVEPDWRVTLEAAA